MTNHDPNDITAILMGAAKEDAPPASPPPAPPALPTRQRVPQVPANAMYVFTLEKPIQFVTTEGKLTSASTLFVADYSVTSNQYVCRVVGSAGHITLFTNNILSHATVR